MEIDGTRRALIERHGDGEVKARKRSQVISKLIGARWEVEDVLLSSTGSGILSLQDRSRLSALMVAIDNIVRRVERFPE